MKPTIFIDTMICNHVVDGRIGSEEWQRVKRYISDHFHYAICPLTMIELILRIGRGSDEYFGRNRRALNVLYGSGERRILPFPGQFMSRALLEEDRPNPQFNPKRFDLWMRLIFKARDKASLKQGKITLRGIRHIVYELDLDSIDHQHKRGIDEHVRNLEEFRLGNLIRPTREEYAAGIFEKMGRPLNTEEQKQVSTRLSAAYAFDTWLWNMAKNKSYDFAKHPTNWVDLQNLMYLCEPSMYFLTNDTDISREASETSQASQILPFAKALGIAQTM